MYKLSEADDAEGRMSGLENFEEQDKELTTRIRVLRLMMRQVEAERKDLRYAYQMELKREQDRLARASRMENGPFLALLLWGEGKTYEEIGQQLSPQLDAAEAFSAVNVAASAIMFVDRDHPLLPVAEKFFEDRRQAKAALAKGD